MISVGRRASTPGLALTHSNVGAHEEARRSAHRAIDAAVRSGDDVTRGQAHYVLSIESFLGGRRRRGPRRRSPGGRGRARRASADGSVRRYWIVGLNHILLGDFERALQAAGQAESLGTGPRRSRSREGLGRNGGEAWDSRDPRRLDGGHGDRPAELEALRRSEPTRRRRWASRRWRQRGAAPSMATAWPRSSASWSNPCSSCHALGSGKA